MTDVHFIKSFSKGQVTIPKKLRLALNLGEDFWLKIYVSENNLVAEPVYDNVPDDKYLAELRDVLGEWSTKTDWTVVRDEVERRLEEQD